MAILCPSDASAPGHKSRTDITFLLYNDYLRYVRPCCVRLTPRTDKRSMKSLMSECPTTSPYGGNVFPDIPQRMLPKDHTFPYFDYPNSSAVLNCACSQILSAKNGCFVPSLAEPGSSLPALWGFFGGSLGVFQGRR